MPGAGAILDCNNVPLAAAGPFSAWAWCRGHAAGQRGKLSLLLDVPESEIRRLLEQSWVRGYICSGADRGRAAWQQLREALTAVKGVRCGSRKAGGVQHSRFPGPDGGVCGRN